ncbi:MAG: transglutaminase domain-containing protein [Phycisphaerales bacterium]
MRRFLFVLLVAIAALGSRAGADWATIEERWFELSFAGTPCGYAHGLVERDGAKFRTTNASTMRLARGTTKVSVEIESAFVESADGAPIEARVRQSTGGPPTVTAYRFVERTGSGASSKWKVEVLEGGKTRYETVDGAGWLAPQATDRFILERLKSGAKDIAYRTVDLEGGLRVAAVQMKRSGDAEFRLLRGGDERTIPVSVWSVVNDLVSVQATERYSSDGELVESVTKLGIGDLRSRLVDEKTARAAAANSSAEVLVKSFVPTKRPIRGARERDRLVLTVTSREGDVQDFPSAGSQRVRRVAPNELEVDVDVDRGSPATKAERDDPRWVASSPLVDADSKEVRELLAQMPPRDPNGDVRSRADQIRRFVGNWIADKNLASAFASASEAARSRAGDCSEHAVLLAAMLRADGIPARVASGLIYADHFAGERNVWGWHVWVQACVPGNGGADGEFAWIDFDATLPTRFDAAHVLTGVSDLAGGATDPMWTSSLSLLGNLSIDVASRDREEEAKPKRSPAPAR